MIDRVNVWLWYKDTNGYFAQARSPGKRFRSTFQLEICLRLIEFADGFFVSANNSGAEKNFEEPFKSIFQYTEHIL